MMRKQPHIQSDQGTGRKKKNSKLVTVYYLLSSGATASFIPFSSSPSTLSVSLFIPVIASNSNNPDRFANTAVKGTVSSGVLDTLENSQPDTDFTSFRHIELHQHNAADEGPDGGVSPLSNTCLIRTIPKNGDIHNGNNEGFVSRTIVENMERNVWSSHSSKSGSGGLFLWYAPTNLNATTSKDDGATFQDESWKDVSNVDLRFGDWAIGNTSYAFHQSEEEKNNEIGTGTMVEGSVRWLACARQTRYWMGPAFGGKTFPINPENSARKRGKGAANKNKNCLPFDTQFLLVELGETKQNLQEQKKSIEPKMYALVLPLVDGKFRSSLQSGRDTAKFTNRKRRRLWDKVFNRNTRNENNDTTDDTIFCHIDSMDDEVHFSALLGESSSPSSTGLDPNKNDKLVRAMYVIVGSNPYKLLKQGFRDVADELQTFNTLDRKQIPSMVDDFGWCTWDAFCE